MYCFKMGVAQVLVVLVAVVPGDENTSLSRNKIAGDGLLDHACCFESTRSSGKVNLAELTVSIAR